MQCRKGPSAVRTGHTATFTSLDLRKAGAKTQDLGPRRSSDRAGACAWHLCKNSKSAITLLQMVLATPHYPPNAKTPRFGIRNSPKHTTHELQHTAGTTSPSVTPWEFAGVVWEVACSSEKPGWAHDTAKTEAGQRRERHLGRSWWSLPWHVASSGRALLPAVRDPTKPAK
jgi:hypothetical protein